MKAFGACLIFTVIVSFSVHAWPHPPIHLPMGPDAWMSNPSAVDPSDGPPKPEPLAILAEAIKAGGRVRIVVENGQAFEHAKPWERKALITNVPQPLSEAIKKWPLSLDSRVRENFSGNLRITTYVFAVFTDEASLGKEEKLLGYELQIRFPTFSKELKLPMGLTEEHYFFGTDGIPHLMKNIECRAYLDSLM